MMKFRSAAAVTMLKLVDHLDAETWQSTNNDGDVDISCNRKLSNYLFPSIVRRIFVGSRAEGLFHYDSDFDFMYEIGPVPVYNKKQDGNWYAVSSCKPGFYLVMDEADGLVHPVLLQLKVAPGLMLRNIGTDNSSATDAVLLQKPSPALPVVYSSSINSLKKTERKKDTVVALRLGSWPDDVREEFKNRPRRWPSKDIVNKICDGMYIFAVLSHT